MLQGQQFAENSIVFDLSAISAAASSSAKPARAETGPRTLSLIQASLPVTKPTRKRLNARLLSKNIILATRGKSNVNVQDANGRAVLLYESELSRRD